MAAAEDRDIVLRVVVPSFGTDEQAIQSAARVKQMLQTSISSRVTVEIEDEFGEGSWRSVPDVKWENIE